MNESVAHLQALADQCVRCGLCLPHCPTYALDRVESESPRGRIGLAQALADGRLDAGDAASWHGLDHCLGCRRCEVVCPADVQYGAVLAEARRLQRQARPLPLRQRIIEWLARRPRLTAGLLGGVRWLRPALPSRWRATLPSVPAAHAPVGLHRADGAPRGTVGLFLGCFARRLDAPAHAAAIRVLNRLGWDVLVPPAQGCCGALHRHAGDAATEGMLGAGNRAAFDVRALSAVLVSASGCFESLRDALRAQVAVRELLEFVGSDAQLDRLALRALDARVALHVPCTQANVVRAGGAAAAVLGRIPGLELVALPLGCCGAAGSHMLVQPRRAAAQRAPLLAAIAASDATQLATGNIGCRLHLQSGLTDAGRTMTVRHPIELLADALP